MQSSHVVTEHESKTLWLITALIFIVLSWNIQGLYSPNKHHEAGGWDHSPAPDHGNLGDGQPGATEIPQKGRFEEECEPRPPRQGCWWQKWAGKGAGTAQSLPELW